MECSSVLQSLNTLWFFNNILTPSPSSATEEKAIPQKDLQADTSVKCPEFEEHAAEEKVKVNKMEEEGKEEVEVECSPKGSESEKKEDKGSSGKRSLSSRRRRRRRRAREEYKRRLFSEKRVVLGEIFDCDIDDDQDNDDENGRGYSNIVEETKKGYYCCYDHSMACGFRIGNGSGFGMRMEMPPLSDGNAMKEHLKHWAHAVASTVVCVR